MIELNIERKLKLPNGQTLELAMSDEFVTKVRKHFDIPAGKAVTDDQLRMFVWGAMNTAVEKAEKQSLK